MRMSTYLSLSKTSFERQKSRFSRLLRERGWLRGTNKSLKLIWWEKTTQAGRLEATCFWHPARGTKNYPGTETWYFQLVRFVPGTDHSPDVLARWYNKSADHMIAWVDTELPLALMEV